MIILDTHVWIWWIEQSPRLRPEVRNRIERETEVRICAISLLEIATATSVGRLVLDRPTDDWLQVAQAPDRLSIEPLTAALCLESTRLPGTFHRDPADRLIVALARQFDCDLATADGKILAYADVKKVDAGG